MTSDHAALVGGWRTLKSVAAGESADLHAGYTQLDVLDISNATKTNVGGQPEQFELIWSDENGLPPIATTRVEALASPTTKINSQWMLQMHFPASSLIFSLAERLKPWKAGAAEHATQLAAHALAGLQRVGAETEQNKESQWPYEVGAFQIRPFSLTALKSIFASVKPDKNTWIYTKKSEELFELTIGNKKEAGRTFTDAITKTTYDVLQTLDPGAVLLRDVAPPLSKGCIYAGALGTESEKLYFLGNGFCCEPSGRVILFTMPFTLAEQRDESTQQWYHCESEIEVFPASATKSWCAVQLTAPKDHMNLVNALQRLYNKKAKLVRMQTKTAANQQTVDCRREKSLSSPASTYQTCNIDLKILNKMFPVSLHSSQVTRRASRPTMQRSRSTRPQLERASTTQILPETEQRQKKTKPPTKRRKTTKSKKEDERTGTIFGRDEDAMDIDNNSLGTQGAGRDMEQAPMTPAGQPSSGQSATTAPLGPPNSPSSAFPTASVRQQQEMGLFGAMDPRALWNVMPAWQLWSAGAAAPANVTVHVTYNVVMGQPYNGMPSPSTNPPWSRPPQ